MGEPAQLNLDLRLELGCGGSKITLDAGLLAHGELGEALGRQQRARLCRICSRSEPRDTCGPGFCGSQSPAACEDVNDAEQLAVAPAMRATIA